MMTMTRRIPMFLTLALCSLAPLAAHAADVDILACAAKEKEAISPTDVLNCQWKNGVFDATLTQIYSDGWRIIETAFFDGNRQVIYLEKPTAPAS